MPSDLFLVSLDTRMTYFGTCWPCASWLLRRMDIILPRLIVIPKMVKDKIQENIEINVDVDYQLLKK